MYIYIYMYICRRASHPEKAPAWGGSHDRLQELEPNGCKCDCTVHFLFVFVRSPSHSKSLKSQIRTQIQVQVLFM